MTVSSHVQKKMAALEETEEGTLAAIAAKRDAEAAAATTKTK